MSEWYRAYGSGITPVKCVKETPKTIVIERSYDHFGKQKIVQDRCYKRSQGYGYDYFSTWEEAKNHITTNYEQKIEIAKRVLSKAENKLNEAKSLIKPTNKEKRDE